MASWQPSGGAGVREEQAGLPLTVIAPSGERHEVRVTRSPFRIGRLQDCELTLRDSRISRNHAQILIENGCYVIEDAGSRHGIYVNGEKVERRELRLRDTIEFGVEDSYRLIIGKEVFSGPLLEKVASMPSGKKTGELGRLSAVLEVARALQSSMGVDDVLTAAVDAALVLTKADRGFLMLKSKDGELELRVARDRYGNPLSDSELRVPRRLIQEALNRRRDLLSMSWDAAENDTAGDAGQGADRTVLAMQLRSALCVPLVRIRLGHEGETSLLSARNDTLGVLYLDSREITADLAAGNRELLQSLAIEISTVLENARLLEEEALKRRLDQELKIARDIQQALLPASLPEDGWLVAAGRSDACQQVGGDYYDVMHLPPDHWGAVLADVSGKGVSAALLTSLIQGAFFATASAEGRLCQVVNRINRYLCERSRSAKFATVFYCLISRNGLARWVNAGHCPALLARSGGGIEWLPPASVPIGLFPEAQFEERESQLQPGDKLVLYSDGVSEAANYSWEQFGEERLAQAVRASAGQPAQEVLRRLLEQVNSFTAGAPQRDDVTLLVLDYRGGSAAV